MSNLSFRIFETNAQVLLPAYGGNSIKVGDEEYTLYKSSEILAIINDS
jgi:chaperonin GroES